VASTLVNGGCICHCHSYPVEMAQNFWTAIYAFSTATIVTVTLSFFTRQQKTDEDLRGLVYSLTPRHTEHGVPWFRRTTSLGIAVLAIAAVLTIIFW